MNKLGIIFPLVLSVSTNGFASHEPNLKFAGKIEALIPIHQGLKATNQSDILANGGKKITFERIVLSQAAQQYLAKHIDDVSLSHDEDPGAKKIDLGMNLVPVLDQGQHGTCVTFANTAILDATIGKGDYISQLCNLELGNYLEAEDKEYPSGWDGSWGEIVLDQIQKYGVINKTFQNEKGCAGVYEYPLYDPRNIGEPMSIDSFTQNSEKLDSVVTWKTILPPADALSKRGDPQKLFAKAKQALLSQHRLSVGILVDVKAGGVGAFGSYKEINDTWVVTRQIAKDARRNLIEAGHELIITGFDDNAEVTDPDGKKHKGLFILRNSWGTNAGDSGNYYMSYDYFKKLAVELIEIVPQKA